MIISYTHKLIYPFDKALEQARSTFPTLDLSSVKTPIDLERVISEAGEVMYVDADFEKQNEAAAANAAVEEERVQSTIGVLECPEDGIPATYTQEELDALVFCEIPKEYPDPVNPSDFEAELAELETELNNIANQQFGKIQDPNLDIKDDATKMLECVAEMQDITDRVNRLVQRETRIRETSVNMEEYLYNYRIMDTYFRKRVYRLDEILNIFDPLITEQRRLEAEVERFTPIYNEDKRKFEELDRIINPSNYTSNVSGVASALNAAAAALNSAATQAANATTQAAAAAAGAVGLSGVSGALNNTYMPQYSQQQYQDWQIAKAKYDESNTYFTGIKNDLQTVIDQLTMEKNKISPFVDADLTINDYQTYGQGAEAQRRQVLQSRLNGLFSGGYDSVYQRISRFSSRTNLIPEYNIFGNNSVNPSGADTFDLEIRHTLRDAENILVGRPKTYNQSSGDVRILDVEPGTPSGLLYEKLYNIWDDDTKFFTLEEKGLTAQAENAASNLKGTGSEAYKGAFIGDVSKFRAFYENFPVKWEEKVNFVKNNVIEPGLAELVSELELMAIREVEYVLAYGLAFQTLPAEDQWLGNTINYIRQSSQRYLARVDELRDDFVYVKQVHTQSIKDIEIERGKYLLVKCAANTAPPEQGEPSGAGSDPFGAESLKANDPSKPNPTKWCYWVKFAAYATAVNVLPLPGQGGFRYWPIGLTIPNPTGITKIPLPIIWIPIAVIPLQVGIFVVFIGLCGICPSPVVFYIGPNGEKKFIISLRPGQEFGTNAETHAIKTISDFGVGLKVPIPTLVNQINVPGFTPMTNADTSSSLMGDIKEKVIKNIQKLPDLPDVSKINALNPSATLVEKRDALLQTINDHIDKAKIPDLKFPKDGNKINPKPLPVMDILDQLKKQFKLSLPQIAIPATEKINLKSKLIAEVQKLKPTDVQLDVPPVPAIPEAPEPKSEYLTKVRDNMKKYVNSALSKITPETLGVVAELTTGVTFINPYQCKGTISGLSLPAVPPAILGGIVLAGQLANNIIDGVTQDELEKMMNGLPFNQMTGIDILTSMLDKMPNVEVPNPSKVSIKDMIKNSIKGVVKMQLPSLPDPTKPPQIRISVPGELVKGSLKTGIQGAVNAFPIDTLNFQNISPIDMKQILISIVEDSFDPVEQKLGPFLDIAANFKDAKDKTFPELIGMSKVSPDVNMVPVVTKETMDRAMDAIKALSLVPYPAVAIAPQAFKKLHPVLAHDDLPPWERFTLDNFLFVTFLDEWCKQGKKTCGFFENP